MKKNFICLFVVFALLLSLFTACGDGARSEEGLADAKGEYWYSSSSEDANYGYSDKYGDLELPDLDQVGVVNDSSYWEKIIKTVSINAQTKEYDKTLTEILSALADVGGYEESVESSGRDYDSDATFVRQASLRLRVPAEQLDAFLDRVGALINVTSRTVSKANVTEQYYDTQARLSVLEAEKAAYEAMLEKAVNIEELLTIKDRLYNTISEIESAKTTLKMYDSKVAYSTVTMYLREVREYSAVEPTTVTFGQKLSNAFHNSWRNFANGFQNFTVWFVGAIPTLLVWAAVITGLTFSAICIVKKVKKTRKQDTESKE